MSSPETPRSHHEPGSQYDFFSILDNAVPNEDVQRFSIEKSREFVFDPKERNTFTIFDYISQTTAEVHFDNNGNIVTLDITRMGGESGSVETAWRKLHQGMAEKILSEHAKLLGITNH